MTAGFPLLAVLAAAGFLATVTAGRQDPQSGGHLPANVQEPAGSIPGAAAELNAGFVDPALDIDQWVARFELESREIYASRSEILKHLNLAPGTRVADIGAGTGFFALMFAEAVGETGQVYAVDIGSRFLEHIVGAAAERKLQNVVPVLAGSHSCNLPRQSVDLVFICDTYHHFEQPTPTLQSIDRALARGGEIVIIDFERIPGQSRPWVIEHVRGDKAAFRRELESCGFEFVEEVAISTFSENYFLRFRRKNDGPSTPR